VSPNEFVRQADLLMPEETAHKDVRLVGIGSLGGAILLALCKMGCGIHNRITILDFDRCEAHNLPTQWIRRSHVALRRPKVEAVAEVAELVCEREVVTSQERFTGAEEGRIGPVLILAVDSIEERTSIWSNIKNRGDVELLIDARMGGEIVEVHSVLLGRDDRAFYEATLHDPADVFPDPCTGRSIVYTAFGAAAFVASIYRSWVRGAPFPRSLAFDFGRFFVETSARPEPS